MPLYCCSRRRHCLYRRRSILESVGCCELNWILMIVVNKSFILMNQVLIFLLYRVVADLLLKGRQGEGEGGGWRVGLTLVSWWVLLPETLFVLLSGSRWTLYVWVLLSGLLLLLFLKIATTVWTKAEGGWGNKSKCSSVHMSPVCCLGWGVFFGACEWNILHLSSFVEKARLCPCLCNKERLG